MSVSELLPPKRGLFTALFPSTRACAAIDAQRQRWAGLPRRLRPTRERMHLTLQFHDRVSAEQEQAWCAALARLRFAPFEIALVRAELWRAPRGSIAVLRADPSAELMALHEQTERLAAQAGLLPERRPYKPHLTVLRQAERLTLEPLAAPICWQVQEVALVRSDLQSQPPRYELLGRFGAG